LVSGDTGSNKTAYLLQLLNDWTAGIEVLGRKSFPVPFCYMCCARGRDETGAIISRLELKHLPPDSLVTLPRSPSVPEDVSLESALKLAKSRIAGLKLLVLDGIGALCRGRITEYNIVADFMRKVHDICTGENLTIIGVGPHSKADNEGPPRSRFLGSVAWGEHASTMIVQEFKDETVTVNLDGVVFSPEAWTYELDGNGRFVLTTDDSVAFGALEMKLGQLQPGDEFETSLAKTWGKDIGCAAITVERWLKRRVEDGVIERVKRGLYKRKFSV
jgi:hypothetical protein